MNNRIWILGTAILAIAIIALGWFLGISPKLAEAGIADTQTKDVTAVNDAYAIDLAGLIEQFEGLDEVKDELLAVRESMPDEGQYADFIRQLGTTSAVTGIEVLAIQFDIPSPWVVGATTPIVGAPETPAATAVEGALVVIPVSVTTRGPKVGQLGYIELMRTGSRLFVTTGFAMLKEDETTHTLNMQGLIYAYRDPAVPFVPKVVDPTAVVPAPVETPAPEDTATPNPTDTPTPTPTP